MHRDDTLTKLISILYEHYFVRFYNVKNGDAIRVFDVGGNLVYESTASAAGSFDWNLVSRTRNQVVTGMYYWQVGDQSGKLAVIR